MEGGAIAIGKYDAQSKWAAEHTSHVGIKLFHGKDADIISWLSDQPSKQGAIKQAIRFYLSHKASTLDGQKLPQASQNYIDQK